MSDLWMWPITFLAVIGTFANIHKKRWCFILWFITNVVWTVYDIKIGAYSQAGMMFFYTGTTVYGWWMWREAK